MGSVADFGGLGIGKPSSDGTNSTLALHECSRGIGVGSWFVEIASVMKGGRKPSAPLQVAIGKSSVDGDGLW